MCSFSVMSKGFWINFSVCVTYVQVVAQSKSGFRKTVRERRPTRRFRQRFRYLLTRRSFHHVNVSFGSIFVIVSFPNFFGRDRIGGRNFLYFDVSCPVHMCLLVCCTRTVNDSTYNMCSAAFSGQKKTRCSRTATHNLVVPWNNVPVCGTQRLIGLPR